MWNLIGFFLHRAQVAIKSFAAHDATVHVELYRVDLVQSRPGFYLSQKEALDQYAQSDWVVFPGRVSKINRVPC
jgi:hypothetical protein